MMPFPDWFAELKENSLFWGRMIEMYPRKNLTRIAEETHAWLVAKEDKRDMPSCRSLFMNFARNAPDGTIVNTVQEKEVVTEWKPVSWEERSKWLQEWQKKLNESPMMKPAYKPPSERIAEEGKERVKGTDFHRSEVETRIVAIEHVKAARLARRKMFLEAFPEASEPEVQAYILKFESIDNPDGL